MTYQFTNKTHEVIAAAQQLAFDNSHIELTPAHIAIALFAPNIDGVAQRLCSRVGVILSQVMNQLNPLLSKIPSQTPGPQVPGDVQPSRATQKVIADNRSAIMSSLSDIGVASSSNQPEEQQRFSYEYRSLATWFIFRSSRKRSA